MTKFSSELRVYRAAVSKFGVKTLASAQGVSTATVERYINGYYVSWGGNVKTAPQSAFNTALALLSGQIKVTKSKRVQR